MVATPATRASGRMAGLAEMEGSNIMKKQVLMLAAFAFILTSGAAVAEEIPGMRDEKIFKAMDTDKDGTLTLEEIQAFMRGAGKFAPKEHDHEHE